MSAEDLPADSQGQRVEEKQALIQARSASPTCLNCHSPKASEWAGCLQCGAPARGPKMTKRGFMRTTGAVGAAAGVMAIGISMPVAAERTSVNFDSELVPNPFLDGQVTISELDLEEHEYYYEDDSDDPQDLRDFGASYPPRADEGDEDDPEPENPVEVMFHNVEHEQLKSMPAGVEKEDPNDDTSTVDVTWHDDANWGATDDGSGITSTIAENTRSLELSTDGVADTESVTFAFDPTNENWLEITSNPLSRVFQIIANVTALDAGTTVTIKAGDGTNFAEVTIDSTADLANLDVMATATETEGILYQEEIGDLNDNVTEITDLEVVVENGDATIELFGLNLERATKWHFGEREILDDDDELDTEAVREGRGPQEIIGLHTVEDAFSSATFFDVVYQTRLTSGNGLDDEPVVEFRDGDRYGSDHIMKVVYQLETPRAWMLNWDFDHLGDTVRHRSQAIETVDYKTIEDDEIVDSIEDFGDDFDEDNFESKRSEVQNTSLDEEVELVSNPDHSDVHLLVYEILLSSDEKSAIEDVSTVTGAPDEEPRGILSHVFSLPGMIISSVIGVLGLRRAGFLGGRGG